MPDTELDTINVSDDLRDTRAGETTRALYIVFSLTDSGGVASDKTLTISMKDPKSGLTLAEVQTAAASVVTNQFFKAGNYFASALKETYIREVTYEELV